MATMAHFYCRRPAGAVCFSGLLSSLVPEENADEEEVSGRKKLPPPQPRSGWINDVIARAMMQAREGEPILQLLTIQQQRRLLNGQKVNVKYTTVVEAVNSENLQGALREVAMSFLKKSQGKQCQSGPSWQQKVWQIVELKRQSQELQEESDHCWRRRFVVETLKAHRILEKKESLESKLQRMSEFWPQFHQLCRSSEDLAQMPAGIAVAKAAQTAVDDAPGEALNPQLKGSQSLPSLKVDDGSLHYRGTRYVGVKGAEWKTRAARSRWCTSPPKDVTSQAPQAPGRGPPRPSLSWSMSQKLQDTSIMDPLKQASPQKKLRHLMIRKPVQSEISAFCSTRTSLSPKAGARTSLSPKAASASPQKKQVPGSTKRRRSQVRRQSEAYLSSMMLSEGGIKSWSDLGMGRDKRKTSSSPAHSGTPRADQENGERRVSFIGFEDSLADRAPPSPSNTSESSGLLEPSRNPLIRRPVSAAALRHVKDSTTNIYLQECASQKLLPRPSPIITGHSCRLDERHVGLNDAALNACRACMAQLSVEVVDLEANMTLSDQTIADFVVSLGAASLSSLSFLSLKGCAGAGPRTSAVMLEMLPDFNNLKTLDLTGIKINMQAFHAMCSKFGKHPSLESLQLADLGIGSSGTVGSSSLLPSLDSILSSQTLRELDLSWNLLDPQALVNLGQRVRRSNLSSLRIASCATQASDGGQEAGQPAAFLEYLSSSCPLKELDISLNRLDYRAAIVLEDFLSQNPRLTALNLSHNPLGPVGIRSLVRLLVREESGLSRIHLEGCSNGEHPSSIPDLQFINTNNPGGHYDLQLDRPDHRSLLRMLYQSCDRLGIPAGQAFSHIQYSRGNYSHPSVGEDGVYEVRTDGRLQATFKVEKAIHQFVKVEEDEFERFFRKRDVKMRLYPSEKKQLLLFDVWRYAAKVMPDQVVFLNALARDIHLPFSLVDQLCKSCNNPEEVVWRLFPSFASFAVDRCLLMMQARSISDVIHILGNISKLMFFNVENPTGHYRLDLSNPAEYSVAESLVLLDSWETAVKQAHGKVDVSQKGNWSQVRNPLFCDHPFEVPIITEWLVPEAGKLELDYSSSRRPPKGAAVMDADTFQRMLIALQDQNFYKKGITADPTSDTGPADQAKLPRDDMQALRMVAHLIHLTALQTRALLECFLEESDREDCVVTLFNRIADLHNEKVFSVRFSDGEQLDRLRKRLGTLVFFPWIQLEQANFALHLENFDERTALCSIIHLAKKERLTNIQRPRWIKGDGTEDPLTFGLPRSWETFSNVPAEGVVYLSYKCAPEDRNFKVRKAHLETYSNWVCDVTEKEVLWWASANEVPVDVMEFLEFLIEDYDDVYEAFDDIKRPNSTVLTLRDFEQGLRRLNCTKFKGRREMEQIMGVFRYLDPSGEGQVSRNEWGMLELCHKEMVYSIKEFVNFCQRSFGNDLNAAWAVFDVNGDNFISEQEWVSVARSSCYFGPTLPIFRFLDKDDEGTISFEEFEELHKFHEPPRPDLQALEQGIHSMKANGAMMRDLLPTRIRVRARLARARAGGEGGQTKRPVLLDKATLEHLQKAIPKSASAMGGRVIAALEKMLAAHGVKSRRVTMMKTNHYKDGLRELVCEVDIPDTASPCGLQRALQASFEVKTAHSEAAPLLHALRLACAQVSTLQVEVRPSRERLVNNLRMAIPNIGINARRAEAIMEAALKCAAVYKPQLDVTDLSEVLSRPSKYVSGGQLVVAAPEILQDPPWQGVQELSGLLAMAGAAHQQLKERLAPGSSWAKSVFGDQVPRTHQSRTWNGASMISNGSLFDPGVKKRERLSQEVILAQRTYEQQDTAAHDLVASGLHVHFRSMSDLRGAWDILETALDVIWVNNRFSEPDAFGYPCVQLGVRQQVQDPRYSSKECILAHISEITLHYDPLWQVKKSKDAEALHEELQDSLARCGINGNNFHLAEAVVANVLDCTQIQMQRSAAAEVERVLAFMERYSLRIGEEERNSVRSLLWESVAEAEAMGCARSDLLKIVARHTSHFVRTSLQLQLGEEVLPLMKAPARRPVLTRICALVSALKVEQVEFHFKDGLRKVFSTRVLLGDAARDGTQETQEISFDLLGDYIVAVEQGAVGHSNSLGVQVLFFTAKGEVLSIAGRRHHTPPSRVRFEAQNMDQIVGLEVEFGRIVGIQSALLPAVENEDMEETHHGAVR